ncbi:hypothetical protein [Breoghania sp.]|uniref:hypothetical protein n=1 Tax=Breoghania sp. TaxID=2065378 RepID=UPI00261AFE89|nr:hypothetical protein [Breoghania sp.]MDJ0932398.1 hypothetical protein [Breoghania sp.]
MPSEFLPSLSDPAIQVVIAAAIAAAAVRGFAGFGAAMIFMPAASAVIDPRLAGETFLVMNDIVALPVAIGAVRLCD